MCQKDAVWQHDIAVCHMACYLNDDKSAVDFTHKEQYSKRESPTAVIAGQHCTPLHHAMLLRRHFLFGYEYDPTAFWVAVKVCARARARNLFGGLCETVHASAAAPWPRPLPRVEVLDMD